MQMAGPHTVHPLAMGRFPVGWLALWLVLSLLPGRMMGADGGAGAVPGPVGGIPRGRLLAMSYCQQCHAMPEPEHLDRATWQNELLPKMAILAGVHPVPTNGVFFDLDVLLGAGYFPKKPMIPTEIFNEISAYYIQAAPEATHSRRPEAEIQLGLKQFSPIFPAHRRSPALTTLTRISPSEHAVVMGDATYQGVDFLSPRGELLTSVMLGNIPTTMVESPRGFYFGCIGHFFPRDQQLGQVLLYERKDRRLVKKVLAEKLPRVSDMQVADLNGDGREDFVLCAYGNFLGRLSWYEGLEGGDFKEHVLLDKPGALRASVRDWDGDGKPDIAVLFAQALESFMVFLGDGRGAFRQQIVFQRSPSWGHSSFDVADFDGDGQPDLVVTNGDNADFKTSPMRGHHGVRILRNMGGLKFEERWFFPLNGAYRAVARDFDGDGDIDIAAISFFPDYEKSPRESFVYLENQGGRGSYQFSASTFRECVAGRWLTLEAGDLDGDGAEDLVLGSLIQMPTVVPDFLKKQWEERGPSVVILRNRGKRPSPPVAPPP